MCALTLPHTHTQKHTPTRNKTVCPSQSWHHHGEMDCHDFMVNCQFLPLSVFSGIKEEDVVYKRGVPILPTVSTHHMASACADLWGLRLVPRLTAPHESNNVSLKPKLQSVHKCVHACACQKGNAKITTRTLAAMTKSLTAEHTGWSWKRDSAYSNLRNLLFYLQYTLLWFFFLR